MTDEVYPKYLSPSSHVIKGDPHLHRLIEEVKRYPCLYNINSLQYRDQYRKEECWKIISKNLATSPSDLKKEWKRLRDGYRQALVTRQPNKNDPLRRKPPLRPWKYEEKMNFLKPYMTPRSRLLANTLHSDSESDEYEYHPSVLIAEKTEILTNIITNIKREVISDEERLSQSSVHESPEVIRKRQQLEKEKKKIEKVPASTEKGSKRKNMDDNDDSPCKLPCVNIIVPDKDGNFTMPRTKDKSKPKNLRYVTYSANNLQNGEGPSATNLNNQTMNLNNPQSTHLNNTTPVIIMNERSIEKIISNFENINNRPANNSNIAINSVIGNFTVTSNVNVVNNTDTTSSGICDNNSAIISSVNDRTSTPFGTSNTDASVSNAVQTNLSAFSRNVAIQCKIPKPNKDGEIIKQQSFIDDLKDGAVAVFVHTNPNFPESDDESDEDFLVSSTARVRKYSIPEFKQDPTFANPHYFRNSQQVYRAVRPSSNSNGNIGSRPIELFIASIYQTIKELPWQGQNTIKTRSLEFLKVAEEEFEQVKVHWNENPKINSTKPRTRHEDLVFTSLYPSSNQNNQDINNKDNQDIGNKDNQDIGNKDNQDIGNKDDHGTSNQLNQGTSNQENQNTGNKNHQNTIEVNQDTRYSQGQSNDPISSLQSIISIFGDNDSRHVALRLFLASLNESMKNMPSYLLNYLKANLMQLVVHVEEIYKNPNDFRNKAVSNKNDQ